MVGQQETQLGSRMLIDGLKEEIINVLLKAVNLRRVAASRVVQMSDIFQTISHPGSFEDIFADEECIPHVTKPY